MIAQAAGKHNKSTLLSWNPSASASHYEVLAASEVNLSVYLQPQPATPKRVPVRRRRTDPDRTRNSRRAAGQRGGARSVRTDRDDQQLRTSSRPRNAHRVYEVIAENAAGEKSEPSNVQTMPTPEPAATFGSVRGVLGSSALGRASIARAGAPSPAQRLLDAAQAAAAQGDRAQALR